MDKVFNINNIINFDLSVFNLKGDLKLRLKPRFEFAFQFVFTQSPVLCIKKVYWS